ncbi:Glycosyltransferases involved in cell wall biogenesis [Methanocella conradii HZ254]|uniref:Glycosyltransferases involved in cell wall biogenesis n=1 Tax=Methanocella conradii (strain DSM 24694 / JCM 17849 / CGMCC 1.5162 / HZ254) TaxID=1041930 RepID=H8I6R7_METCZ|nr:glycosyltransferase family 2 protein [Methanocella conradii]AFC99387.1 Glycosyltransferases involved in cell wall biogenesis [Methanocella conradii HZ254]
MSGDVATDGHPSLSVVIPIYNESESIVQLYDELTAALDKLGQSYEVIFVDDGSTDGSFNVLSDLCKHSKNLKVIRLRRNSGQSAALSAGFDYSCGDYIITMDGDLQNDPADIPRLLEKMTEGYDVVCGWRVNRKDPLSKKLFSKLSNILRQILIKDKVHDYGCTLRVYKRECINDFELFGEMHRYIPALMVVNGYSVGEVKVNHRERCHGKSKYNWKRLFKGFTDLIVVTFWSRFATRPMHIFGTAGLAIGALGGFVTLYYIFGRIFLNISLADKPMFILSVLSIIIGLQFIVFGILADISLKTYYNQKKFKNYRVEKIIGFSDEPLKVSMIKQL